MEQKNILGIIALSMIAILGISMVSAFGFGKGFGKSFINKNLTDEEKALLDKERTDMENAIANKDFATWKSLMEQRIAKMQSELTQDNFNLIVEERTKMSEMRTAMKEAKQSGDYSKVEELRKQYGLPEGQPNGPRGNRGMGHKKGNLNMTNID